MIAARTGIPWIFAVVAGAPVADPTHPDDYERATVALERHPDGQPLRMRVGELAAPHAALRDHLAGRMSASDWAGYRLGALLSLKNTGLPIAVVAGDDDWVHRPAKLFWAQDGAGELQVRSTSGCNWLQNHLPKHVIRANKKLFGAALRDSPMALNPKVVSKVIGHGRTNPTDSGSWPALELYCTLLALAFRGDGPRQLHIQHLTRSRSASTDTTVGLFQDEAAAVAKCEPGKQALTCETLTGLRAGAIGGLGYHGVSWSTLHAAADPKEIVKRASKAQRNPFLVARELL